MSDKVFTCKICFKKKKFTAKGLQDHSKALHSEVKVQSQPQDKGTSFRTKGITKQKEKPLAKLNLFHKKH